MAPDSYREAFRLAGKHGLLPVDLAERMQNAAGMCNILVHLYKDIDCQILRDSIKIA
ncbi:MAG: HepT-like ribonuclease domain-containing protein, partial [Chloroflexota bacterium]